MDQTAPTSPNTVTLMVSSLSDQDLVRKAVSTSNLAPEHHSKEHLSNPALSLETPSNHKQQQHNHPLLKPLPPDATAQTSPPPNHPLLSAPSEPPRQRHDHPQQSSPSSSARTRSDSSGSLTGLSLPHTGSAGSLSGARPPPPRRSSTGRRLVAGGPPSKSRPHRRVHSFSSASNNEAARGKPGVVEKTLEELTATLKESKKKYGEDHPRVGLVYNSMGNYYFRKGDLSSAGKFYNDALDCFKSVGYKSDCSYDQQSGDASSSSLSSFGSSGSYAIELHQELDVAAALGNIGAVLWSTGNLCDSVKSLEKSIKIRKSVIATRARNGTPSSDKDVTDLSSALYSLGLARCLQGDHDEAMDAFNKAMEELSKLKYAIGEGGSTHRIEVARIEDGRGKVYLLQGDTSSSMECHLRALESKSSILGSSHPSVLATRMNIAAAHRAAGQYDEASAVYHEVLSAQKVSLYRERDPEAKRRATADIGTTMRMIAELQTQSASTRRGSGTKDLMAAIVEENHGTGTVSEDDWGLSRSR